jgi:tRNA (cmo5U34)-methyltransferase
MEHPMHRDELTALFDQQAASYDSQWARTAAIKDCLYFLLESHFAELPPDARILCVGAGTGAEMAHLALKHPAWRFTAVEPSGAMLAVCRQRTERDGFSERCEFHQGYLETLPPTRPHDAATCFLVSQFILDRAARSRFFGEIARRLSPSGLLAIADLAADTGSAEYEVLLRAWVSMMSSADIAPEAIERMRKAYATDVGVLPPATIGAIIEAGGFEPPVPFFQAGLIHAWVARRAAASSS